MQNFDIIDLFIVVGDHKLHPWTTTTRTINTLIRMCLKASKHLLAAS